MIELPFRFPWRTILWASLAGGVAAVHTRLDPWSFGKVVEYCFRWSSQEIVRQIGWHDLLLLNSLPVLMLTLILWLLLGWDWRVWLTFPASLFLNTAMLLSMTSWGRWFSFLAPAAQAVAKALDPLGSVNPGVVLLSFVLALFLLPYALSYGALTWAIVRPRPSLVWLAYAILWLSLTLLVLWGAVLVRHSGEIRLWVAPPPWGTGISFSQAALPLMCVTLWMQALWAALPWMVQESRGTDRSDRTDRSDQTNPPGITPCTRPPDRRPSPP